MSRVAFRPEAEADLASIAMFLAERSVSRAKALVARLRSRCDVLRTSPMAGRPRDEIAPGLRSLVERPYIIFYRLDGDRPEIVAIVHGARDLPAALSARILKEE